VRAMLIAGALGLTLVFAAATAADGERAVKRTGEPDVFLMPVDDARMAAAVTEARGRVEEFITAFVKPAPRQRSFAVKVPVIDGKLIEHFWVDLESFTDGQFTGRIGNQPFEVSNVHFGDRLIVDKERITDWMFVDRGRLVGGFTIRVLRERMGVEERKSFDASLPFEILD
jgi:uncharacterized protein YegJ (DUF2314 family)